MAPLHGLLLVHDAAAHVLGASEVPVQPSPATRYPIQRPPDHEVPAPDFCAHVTVGNGPQAER